MKTAHQRVYLYIPFVSEKSGIGHLMRSIAFAKTCIEHKRYVDIFIAKQDFEPLVSIIKEYSHIFTTEYVHIISSPNQNYSAVFLDTKEISKKDLYEYGRFGPCIGIDLTGEGRSYVPYLIDTLPTMSKHSPNMYALGSFVDLNLPVRSKAPQECKKILFYASHATSKELEAVITLCRSKNVACDIVGVENKDATSDSLIRYIKFTPNIAYSFYSYDLIVSHFGLSVFEAVQAQVPVVLINTQSYHASLANKIQFSYNCTDYTQLIHILESCMGSSVEFQKIVFNSVPDTLKQEKNKSLYTSLLEIADTYQDTYKDALVKSPFVFLEGENEMGVALWRNEKKSIFQCATTKMQYQVSFSAPVSYSKDYFFSEYARQYGKTYLEDASTIATVMKKRLDILQTLRKNKPATSASLIDIGSAYGVMLSCAKECGYNVLGIDVSVPACEYVKNTLQLPVLNADVFSEDFLDIYKDFRKNEKCTDISCDVISCWYVLEHTPFFETVLYNISHLLSVGGILALAVPNGSGIFC